MASLPGPTLDRETETLLRQGHAGGICLFSYNVISLEQLRDLCHALRAAAPGPLLIAADLEGGYVWRLVPPATHPPSAMACGAAGRPDLTEALAHAVGTEMRALGIDVNLAPAVDVNNNPANPVIATRSYGEDPTLVSQHALAAIRGYRAAGIAACAKHFPGHGDTSQDSHLTLPSIHHPLDRLRRVELPPFAAAIQAGVEMVMTAHVIFPALDPVLPATLSSRILGGLLRDELGFDGVICSDAMNMDAMKDRWGSVEASVLSVIAGADMICSVAPVAETESVHAALVDAMRSGRLSVAQVRRSASRMAQLKERLSGVSQPPLSAAGSPAHTNAAANLAAASITRYGAIAALPLRPDQCIAVLEVYAGPRTGAEDTRGLHGRLAEAIRRRAPNVSSLLLDSGSLEENLATARAVASQADAVVLATRNAWRSPAQQELLRTIADARQLILVALRDPYDLRFTPTGAAALAAYCDVPASIDAVAAALFGAPTTETLPVTL